MNDIPIECIMMNDLYDAIVTHGKEIDSRKEMFDDVRVVKRLFIVSGSLWVLTTTNGCITQITTSAFRDYFKK